ncbi:hypothetical protein [Acinetobacter sp. WZC-1]|uniref:hypothetical protein n=1 Tax=Acinetobacter sp. WZC-1 TaxID=3459034 RepID=UPI00403DD2C4
MNTLSISDIFANLNFYKQHYLSIISDPLQYSTKVRDAWIEIWPLEAQPLYLGDLLQLWFSQKWRIDSPRNTFRQLWGAQDSQVQNQALAHQQAVYLYQLKGNLLSGRNQARLWSVLEQKQLSFSVDSVFQYFCIFRALSRPSGLLS